MHRRSLVRTGCSSLFLLLAGCGRRTSDETTQRQTDSSSPTAANATQIESTTPTHEPTTSERTPRQQAEIQHELGNTHRVHNWNISVSTLNLTTKFQRDGLNAVYEVDGDRQLCLVTLRVTNVDDSRQTWSGWPIVAIVNRRVFEDRLAFEHSASDAPLGLEELDQVEHVGRLYPEGYQVESDETFRSWYLFVLPRAVSRRQVQIGLDDVIEDDVPYPIRWIPDDTTPSKTGDTSR